MSAQHSPNSHDNGNGSGIGRTQASDCDESNLADAGNSPASSERALKSPASPIKGTGARKRRPKEERGLPDLATLTEMARVYLDCQNRLWPELVSAGLVLPNTPANVKTLADNFRSRFLGTLDTAWLQKMLEMKLDLAAAYDRYSDPKSNPRSLAQQLRLQLERACVNKHFIPWELVMADAAVTGTTDDRHGYRLIKEAMTGHIASPGTLYIDEVGRASRDAIEALSLGDLLQKNGKRLIGISDGFDSLNTLSKLMLHVFAMLQEWFIDQLREKVNRGMDWAFDIGGNVGLVPLGYKLVPMVDKDGNPVFGRDGARLNMLAIDDGPQGTKRFVEKAFYLYTIRHKSPEFIARYFNRMRVQGRTNWEGTRIRSLLRRPSYNGTKTYRMTKHVRVRKQRPDGSFRTVLKVVKRPKSEWRYCEAKQLQIISDDLWNKTQVRLEEAAKAWHSKREGKGNVRRGDIYPTRLLRPECGVCGHVMYLSQNGKYATYFCPNGVGKMNGCTFGGYKSVAPVESSILRPILTEVLSADSQQRLVDITNAELIELARAPKENVAPLRRELKETIRKLKYLYDLVEQKGLFKGANDRISQYERQKEAIEHQIREAEARNAPLPRPVTLDEVRVYFDRLRELLNQDVAVAAPILKVLTGPIKLFPTGKKQGNRNVWEARFTVNLIPVLVEIGRSQKLPNSGIWEFLNTRARKFEIPVVAVVESQGKYEPFADEFRAMHNRGLSVSAMAAKMAMAWGDANNCLKFALTGERPNWSTTKRGKKCVAGDRKKRQRYKDIADEVVKRRHPDDGLTGDSFSRIAKQLGVGEGTVSRAYDYGMRKLGKEPTVKNGRVDRGRWRRVPVEKVDLTRKLLREGKLSIKEIATQSGLGESTIWREQKLLRERSTHNPPK